MDKFSLIKSLSINSVLVILSLTLTLLLCEGAFYLVNKSVEDESEIATVDANPNEERLLFSQYHSVYGHAGVPGVRQVFFDAYATHNAKGLRGPERTYEKADFAKRVVFIGDSQTWGWGVNDYETIPYYFEQFANSIPQPEVYEAVNLGASGYGIGQSYLRLITEGLRYQPDYVVLTYYAENDVGETGDHEAYGIQKPFMYERADGQLCVSNVPPPKASGWPSDNVEFVMNQMDMSFPKLNLLGLKIDTGDSQIARYFKKTNFRSSLVSTWGSDDSDPVAAIDEHIGCLEKEPGPKRESFQADMDFMIKLILRIRDTVESNGAEFILVAKPFEHDYKSGNITHEYSYVLGNLAAKEVQILDLYSESKKKNVTGEQLFSHFGHLTALGNEVVGLGLVERINPRVLPGAYALATNLKQATNTRNVSLAPL